MTSTTIIIMLAVAVVVLATVIVFLLWHAHRQERDMKEKNDAIIREMYRSQNIIERAVKHGVSRAALLSLLLTICLVGKAQENCFEYEDNDTKTTITGLTETGRSATSLEIPSSVTAVQENAFSGASASTLTVNAASISLGSQTGSGVNEGQFTVIEFCNEMNTASMISVITGMGSLFDESGLIEIKGLDGCNGNINLSSVLHEKTNVQVVLPAALVRESDVSNFNFGEFDGSDVDYTKGAKVYGRFSMPENLTESTFCGNVTFLDVNDGGNLLFYVTTGFEDSQIKLKRVHYILPNEGVLLHVKDVNQNHTVDLERASDTSTTQYNEDTNLFNSSWFKGTTAPTELASTVTISSTEYTNLILYNGAFYRISGGTLGANKAYLQMPSSYLTGASSKVSITFPDDEEETTGISYQPSSIIPQSSEIYNLSGQRVGENYKGIVIVNGKKIIK